MRLSRNRWAGSGWAAAKGRKRLRDLLTPPILGPFWNSVGKPSEITLSNSNKTALNVVNATKGVRGSRPILTGEKIFFTVLTNIDDNPYRSVGVSNTSHSLGVYLGQNANGIGYHGFDFGPVIYNATTVIPNVGAYINVSALIQVCVDRVNNLIWFRKDNGAWNANQVANSDPATGVGGIPIQVTGDLYATVSMESEGQTSVIANTSPYGIPTGFVGLDSPQHGEVVVLPPVVTTNGTIAERQPNGNIVLTNVEETWTPILTRESDGTITVTGAP